MRAHDDLRTATGHTDPDFSPYQQIPADFISSMIFTPLEVPSRVAPASIIAFASDQEWIPPAALT